MQLIIRLHHLLIKFHGVFVSVCICLIYVLMILCMEAAGVRKIDREIERAKERENL